MFMIKPSNAPTSWWSFIAFGIFVISLQSKRCSNFCKKSKVVKGEGWDMHTRFMDKSCTSWKFVQTYLQKPLYLMGCTNHINCFAHKPDHQATSWVDYQWILDWIWLGMVQVFLFRGGGVWVIVIVSNLENQAFSVGSRGHFIAPTSPTYGRPQSNIQEGKRASTRKNPS